MNPHSVFAQQGEPPWDTTGFNTAGDQLSLVSETLVINLELGTSSGSGNYQRPDENLSLKTEAVTLLTLSL